MATYEELLKDARNYLDSIDKEIIEEKRLQKEAEAIRKASIPELEKAEKLALEVSELSASTIKNLQKAVEELRVLKQYDIAYHELKAEEVDTLAKNIVDVIFQDEEQVNQLTRLSLYYIKYLRVLEEKVRDKPELTVALKPKIDETAALAEKQDEAVRALQNRISDLRQHLIGLERRRVYLEEERKKLKEFEFEEEKSLIAIIRNVEKQLNKLNYFYEKLRGGKLPEYAELVKFSNEAMRWVNINPGQAMNVLANMELIALAKSKSEAPPEISTEWKQIVTLINRARSLYRKGLAPRGMTKKGGYEIKAGELE
jgi:hypothetical protein